MKITIDLSAGTQNPVVIATEGKGAGKSFANVCLKSLVVLKSRGFSGSQLMTIEKVIKPLQKVVESLPVRL